MAVVSFTEEPYAVRLLKKVEPHEETAEVCPLLAVDGEVGLVVRDRELFWWPLNLIRVILQPEPVKASAEGEGDTGPIMPVPTV